MRVKRALDHLRTRKPQHLPKQPSRESRQTQALLPASTRAAPSDSALSNKASHQATIIAAVGRYGSKAVASALQAAGLTSIVGDTVQLRGQQAAVMDSLVEVLERKIDYTFQDKDIAKEALQLAGNGYTKIGTRYVTNGHKRLAVVGDNVIDMVLCFEWYGSGKEEGDSDEVCIWPKINSDKRHS